ncbi:DUF4249 domain-containing protein [Chitinophagaceae bacterium LB-8]|uniref:DUF4249 domain-containing protein n=1 Tax=Paraflavisolibacter caeni TaxID=2982496 RepID=A0A9X2XSR9_9BACT|nr:DUF4249 domain-containing protein [Paraflavisolibacter caeni]MCU7547765.1 DUF4249 domain-containing protein [Paraflavisolibacter caeni]
MKKVSNYIVPLLFLFFLASCEKVVDVKVKGAEKKYVVEGVLTNETGKCEVKISQTLNLDDDNTFNGVSGAQVTITDDKGVVSTLLESAPGIYRNNLAGKPGTTYTMEVHISGNKFTAQSTMPNPVAIDSLYISSMDMMGDKTLMPNIVFRDPAEKGNAYRFIQYLNGKKSTDIFVQNDVLSNGRLNTTTLFQHDNDLKKGDSVGVDMLCIDNNVYKYWFSLYQGATGEEDSASPANPETNIKGGALGYFSAHTVSRKAVTVN